MFKRLVDWLRRLEEIGTMASRSDAEILAAEIDRLRERIRELEARN
ncbi:hypothetical protein [Sphingopyxis sp. R3-92]